MSPDEVVKAIALLLPELQTSVTVNAPPTIHCDRSVIGVHIGQGQMLPIRPGQSLLFRVVDTSTEELAANSRSVSDPDPNTPISSCAVKVINPPAVKSAVLSSAASLIDPAVAVTPSVPDLLR